MSIPYGNIADAATYHAARNNTAWAANPDAAQQNAALLVASEYLDETFRDWFTGQKVGLRAQEREWPRNGGLARNTGSWAYYDTIPNDQIPIEVLNATYEAALRQLLSPGSLAVDFTLGGSFKSVTIDGALTVEYITATGTADAQVDIPIIGRIMYPLLIGPAGAPGSTLSSRSVRG